MPAGFWSAARAPKPDWSETTLVALPAPEIDTAADWVTAHLGHLCSDAGSRSNRFRGGQQSADARLAALDIAGYAGRRNEVLPAERRGATELSPYIRHGLLQLETVWNAVDDAPARDRSKFRDELLWQEYARHWYARLGYRTQRGIRRSHVGVDDGAWDRRLPCIDAVVSELEGDGWLVNQTRMWLASDFTVRNGYAWRDGEDHFFRHLLDGSRAANRLGWQWTTGVGSSKSYGFSRWQVEKRAPGLCETCELRNTCPIQDWPDDPDLMPTGDPTPWLKKSQDLAAEAGPTTPEIGEAEAVWLTAESLGDDDPALAANPDLPAVFVFDEPLLARLNLSSKRLVFLSETLAELAERRSVEVYLGAPERQIGQRPVAVTFAPVPGFRRLSPRLNVVETHPWPWLTRPRGASVASFSAWRRAQKV